ncbi:hypothetical protein Tco_1405035 [Tanacetum coccineum]
MIIAGADNRPPMLEKSLYESWKSRLPPHVYAIVNHHKVAKEIWDRVKLLMQGTKLSLQEKECKLYDEFDKFSFVKEIVEEEGLLKFLHDRCDDLRRKNDRRCVLINRENGRMILSSVLNGPLIWPTVTEADGTTRTKNYEELSAIEKIQANCDCKATNIVLQGLPLDVYAIVNHHKVAKEIWDRVKLLMQGTELSLQEKECKLYDEFDKFTFVKGETLYQYYWRFAQLINNMNVINMSIRAVQVNTKFLNSLPLEWSKFVTDVKLARDLHTTNYDQLYSYHEQHEIGYHSPQASTQLMTEFPQMDSGLAIPVFNLGDDPIACLNKAMAFLTAVASSRVRDQQVQGRQGQSYASNSYKGHIARQCTQPKRRRNIAWFKEKAMLTEAQESRQILDEEQLAFLADLDLDAYDSDCDDVSNTKAVLMANLFSYGSDVLSEVPYSKTSYNDMDVQDTNSYAQQDSMILSVIEQMPEQMINHVNNWEKANQEKNNESVIAELERYKERVKTFEQCLNVDLSTREKMIDSQMDDIIKEKLALNLVFDDEEASILEEVSRFKMLAKQNDPISKDKKVNTTLINYAELNRLSEDFGKCFIPQQELSDEQAFWLQTSHPNTDQSTSSPVKIEAPRELPKITPDAITEGAWGFEHTKTVFLKEIIPFLKTLKDIFNVFDKDLLNEDSLSNNQNALEITEYFENNDLKPQLQAKDTTICKLKEHIKSMRENDKEEKVKHEMDEIETINIELEHRLKCSTSTCRSQPTGNKRNDRILQNPSSNRKNKLEAQPRKVDKKNHIQRISLTGFPAQSVGSSNTDVLDSPCLLVLITETSQSRQHGGILRRLEAFVASPIGCGGSDVGIA